MGAESKKRLLTFGSGGWVLLLAGLFSTVLVVWAVAGAFVRHGAPLSGDGRNVDTYGFTLEPCLVPRELLVAGGLRKDALQALVDPPVITVDDVEQLNKGRYSKYLVSTDRVIGVSINGKSRAYPLMILKVHEIANDTLGGVPIAVTYSPLCDSVVVFERTVGDEVLEFGVSGLLYNSNLLMFDRRPDADHESLWSQLQARAVAGPAAGSALSIVDARLTTWSSWRHEHPDTTALLRDAKLKKRYKETKYDTYFRSSVIMFPVQPAAPTPPAPKQRVVAVTAGGSRVVYPLDVVASRAGPDGTWRTTQGDAPLVFQYAPRTDTVTITGDTPPVMVIHALWFAWHAMYPGDPLF